MSRRSTIALTVLGLWLAGLAILTWREVVPEEEGRLERAALLVEPGTNFFMVTRGGEHVGYASSQVDTSVFGVRLRNSLVILPVGEPDSARVTTQYAAQLTPRLRLADFEWSSGQIPDRRVLLGHALGDSALELRRRRGSQGVADTIPFPRFAVPPEVVPFRVALGRTLRVGDQFPLEVFDRGTGKVETHELRIAAETVFVVPDSALRDSATGLYIAAFPVNVTAWQVDIPGEGGGITWFDRGGRVVQQELPGGYLLRRTAFELAFDNWRAAWDRHEAERARTGEPGGAAHRAAGAADTNSLHR